MSLEIGRLTFATPAVAPQSSPAPAQAGFSAALAGAQDAKGTRDSAIPASPPADALDAVDRAGRRAVDLASQNRELNFRQDDKTGRLVVEIRDLQGHVLETIPHAKALDIMSGSPLYA
jgi:hypothetical protein